MKKKPILRAIAIMLIMIQLTDLLAGCSFQKKPTPETLASAETETGARQILDGDSNYFEVTFDYPAGTSEEDAKAITLPQKMMLTEGTLLYAIPQPDKADCVFTGWYYDAALTRPASGNDAVEKNMTLYPNFASAQNLDDEFQINYISTLDVEPDFEIRVAAKGLTASQVKDLVRVWDLNKVDKAEEFVVEPVSDSSALDEETSKDAATARDILARVKAAGMDARAIKTSELFSVLLPEEQKSLGISGGAKVDLKNLSDGGDQVINLELLLNPVIEGLPTEYYVVRPVGGKWRRGDMHQVEILDTASLRFFRNGEETGKYIVYYNITVHQDDFNNIKLNSELVFLQAKEVDGVALDGGLFKADANTDGDITVTKNNDKGVLTYRGSEKISAGMTVAVYDGTLNSDNTVDGSVGYFKITKAMGQNQYAYEGADFTDVVFVPDVIPVRDDGSFQDGEILISADQLKFSGKVFQDMGLDSHTVVEPGDFLAVYTGNLNNESSLNLTGYGCITSVTKEGSGLRVRYDVASEETLRQSSDAYVHYDNIPIPLTEEELRQLGRQMEQDVEESGFLEDSAEYVKALITEDEEAILPDSKYSAALKEIVFQRDDGSDITLEEVRQLAGGSKVEVEWPPKLSFLLGLKLQHFDGTGIRAEAAAEMTITIHMTDNADIEIKVVALIEMEVALGLHCKWEVEWRKAWIFPYIYDIGGTVGLHAGIYVGAGITVTVVTKMKENDVSPDEVLGEEHKELLKNQKGDESDKQKNAFKNLSKVSGKISELAKLGKSGGDGLHISDLPGLKGKAKDDKGNQKKPDVETEEMHNTVGGSFEEKYAAFLQDSDAEYVPLLNKELITLSLPTDPMHLLAVSLGINFVVKFKLNVMLGVSITYGNAKQITANFTIFHPNSSSEVGDLETPNFQVDFYIFGMVGIRVGIEFDLRIGAISTRIASIGVTAEVGVYVEFFGYFYVGYKWTSGKGSSTEMFGSMLAQLGLYLDINFKAQMGNGKLQKSIDLYDVRWPLLSLGDEFCALDFEIGEDDDGLDIDIKEGATAKVPDNLFNINFLALDTGEMDTDDMDRAYLVDNGSPSFTSMGVNYTQYDEANFHVTYKPLGKNFGAPTDKDPKGRFQYDPVTNVITARPETLDDDELWGELTFTWYQGTSPKTKSLLNYGAGFGLNTRVISRTIRVHWKGVPVSGTADVYLCKSRELGFVGETIDLTNLENRFELKETIEFDGLDGVTYFMDLEGLKDRYPGYMLKYTKETYDKAALYEYFARIENYNAWIEFLRGLLYGGGDENNRGWWMVMPGDRFVFFKMHKPETKAKLYFDFHDAESDWHVLDEKANSSKPLASAYELKMPSGVSALESMPDAVKSKIDLTKYDYEWYMYSAKGSEYTNARDSKTKEVGHGESSFDPAIQQARFLDSNGSPNLTNMPAFSEFIGDRKKWVKVTEQTTIPVEETVFFAIRTPKSFNVTWKYEEGDQTTQVKYGEKLTAPVTPAKSGFTFQGWFDENGKKYETMPDRDLILYPKMTGGNRTITWILDGQTKTSSVKAGENPISSCPFRSSGNVGYNWMTVKGDVMSVVTDEYQVPDEDVTLYGVYVYQCDWLLYDSGNGQYVSLTSTYRQQETLFGQKVMSELPEEVKNRMTDNRYEYSLYRYNGTGTDKVKAGQSQWKEIKDDTTFEAGNASYVLRRSPIMIKVTWKYDDGDVVNTNWVGRKLTAPKEISRAGSTFLGWTDSEGRSYDYPPRHEVTLYPQFSGHEHVWDEGTVTKEATCNAKGEMTYQCKECGRTKTEEIPVDLTKHVLKTEKRNEKAPECTVAGSYDNVTFCEVCGDVISSEKKSVPSIGHEWGAVSYEWSSDNKTVKATRVCQHNAKHVETETVNTTATTALAATCETKGKTKYVASFSNSAFKQQTKTVEDIAALGHEWGAPTYEWSGNNKTVKATRVCQHNAKHVETETVNTTSTEALAATCETKGKTKYVASFNNNAFKQQTKTVEDIAALGHDWSAVSYEWSSDNKTVKATRTCQRNAKHVETETVNTEVTVEQPTCEAKGKTKYVATFSNKAFEQKTKTLENIAALGHDWGEAKWDWSGYASATATFTCKRNEGHKVVVNATITSVRTEPTLTAAGSVVYTAKVNFNGKTYQNQQTEILPKISNVKLGSEQSTETGAPALVIDLLMLKLEDYGDSISMGDLNPGEELWLWAYVGESIMDENGHDIDATLVWAENYDEVKVKDVKVGDTYKIRIIPEDTTTYNETIAILTIIEGEPEGFDIIG